MIKIYIFSLLLCLKIVIVASEIPNNIEQIKNHSIFVYLLNCSQDSTIENLDRIQNDMDANLALFNFFNAIKTDRIQENSKIKDELLKIIKSFFNDNKTIENKQETLIDLIKKNKREDINQVIQKIHESFIEKLNHLKQQKSPEKSSEINRINEIQKKYNDLYSKLSKKYSKLETILIYSKWHKSIFMNNKIHS